MRGHVILAAWPSELDWELVTSKITELTSPYCIGGVFFISFRADFGKETFVSCMYLALVYSHNTYILLLF